LPKSLAALFDIEDGQTPLDPDEATGLKLAWIATRSDLNDAGGANIVSGMRWGARQIRGKKPDNVATEGFLRALHTRMFGDVWRWAGMFARPNATLV
jgi:fido (protein-threonine AMPylation protein)